MALQEPNGPPLRRGRSALHAMPLPLPDPRRRPTAAWQRRYQQSLVAVDASVIVLSTLAAMRFRFGNTSPSFHGVSYELLSLVLCPVWLTVLMVARAYEIRFLGTGPDEFKRVGAASLRLLAVVAVVSYVLKLSLARGYVVVALPLGTVLLLFGRYALRRWLHARRRRGEALHRVVAVGGASEIDELRAEFSRGPYAGFQMVGACLSTSERLGLKADIPVLGTLSEILEAVTATSADTVAVAQGPGISPAVLRRLSWDLEGTGVDLVVAPALTDVAGPRISIRPVAGLPLLHVEEPELSGPRQMLKFGYERVFAALGLLFTLPLLCALAVLVMLDSPGSPIFRQTRVGRRGRPFTVYKLRTMMVGAEEQLDGLVEHNEASDGLLFKLRADPRITRIGELLRKWSIDELPQLWNVVRGDMAIVGPRPPLPAEVFSYAPDVARRLLVRPGITGLWQVSGRSDLSWADTVRLDLYYVENWSLALDAMIIWKTIFAVTRREGAY